MVVIGAIAVTAGMVAVLYGIERLRLPTKDSNTALHAAIFLGGCVALGAGLLCIAVFGGDLDVAILAIGLAVAMYGFVALNSPSGRPQLTGKDFLFYSVMAVLGFGVFVYELAKLSSYN